MRDKKNELLHKKPSRATKTPEINDLDLDESIDDYDDQDEYDDENEDEIVNQDHCNYSSKATIAF